MATYAELRTASENDGLLIKVQVACVIAANTVAMELDTVPLHAQRLLWAKNVYENPHEAAKQMVWSVLAKNASATVAQINNVTDAQVQNNVNDSVNVFANVG